MNNCVCGGPAHTHIAKTFFRIIFIVHFSSDEKKINMHARYAVIVQESITQASM